MYVSPWVCLFYEVMLPRVIVILLPEVAMAYASSRTWNKVLPCTENSPCLPPLLLLWKKENIGRALPVSALKPAGIATKHATEHRHLSTIHKIYFLGQYSIL